MKKSKKGLIICICVIVALACMAVGAFLLTGKLANQSGYTVKFELCTELQTTTVLERTVAPGSFLEEPEVYVTESNEENWAISGWYREPEYKTQWDFDFDTVESNLTLYAKWDTNPQCTINFYTEESADPVYTTTIRKGLVATPCDEEFVGREVLGYYSDKAMTQKFDFKTKIQADTDIYVDISEYVYFNAKMISKWNICGNQSEVDEYEVSTSLSGDEEILTVTSKNGGYLYLKGLKLNMNGTSIIQIKMREVNDNYSGAVGGYILGNYTINGEPGASSDFGKPNTGSTRYARSAKPDEDGFYTYTYNISNLTPGLVYTEMNALRIDFVGTDKYTYEIKEIKTFVDEYAVSGEAFTAKGINFTGLHLNTFTLMGEAETKMLENGNLRFGGPNGAYIYKKGLNITLGDEQIIRLKAKGDLNGGAIALFFFGEYTLNGKAGVTTDYTGQHKVTFVAGETDANGYTTYTADISTIPGMKYKVINGIRIDLYGEGTRTIDMQSLKSYAPTKEETEIAKGFTADGLDLKGSHFTTFLKMGEAEGSLLDSGDYKFSGPNGAYLYKKNVEITLDDDQKIVLKAKGDLKAGMIRLYLFGEYTQDGKAGTTTDYNVDHKWDFVAEGTDSEGYTIYSINIDSIKGLKYNTIHGLRLDLYGENTRSIEIQSLKSVVPTAGETAVNDAFRADGLNFTGEHFVKFLKMGDAKGSLLDNDDYSFGGPNGAFIYKKDMEITLGDEQKIVLKAKGDLKAGMIRLYLFGEYTQDGKTGTTTDYNVDHKWDFVAEGTDSEGYTTYSINIDSIKGLKYNTIHGLRLDLYGEGTRTLEIQSLKSVVPSKEDLEINEAFTANGLNLIGAHFNKFLQMNSAETELLDNGDLKLSGVNGSFIYKKELAITLGEDQTIQLKAKTDLNGGRIDIYLFGDYTQDGVAGTTTDYGKHRWIMTNGETDTEGYTTYTFNIGDIEGLEYQTIRGLRVDLIGSGDMSIEIQSMISMVPSDVEVTYYVGDASVYTTSVKMGETISQPEDNLVSMGHEVLGYYSDSACETKFDFSKEVTADTSVYVKLSDYLYFSPAMLKQFNVAAGTAGSATASTELVEGALKMEAVHGSFIYKKGMDLDVSETQIIEFVASATVDVSLIDIWLFGTYTKDGQTYTNTAEDLNLRWRITPDTTGDYVTYTLDLGESPKVSGMVWQKITGIRIDMHLHNINNTGIISIQSIKATEVTDVLEEDFDGETNWSYTDAAGNTGTVPAQKVEEKITLTEHMVNSDFETSTNKWADAGAVPTITAGAGYNGTAGLVLTRTAGASGNPYTASGLNGLDTTGEITYTVSFRAKAEGVTWRLYVIETGSNNWQAVGDYSVTEWDTYSYQFTTTTGKAQLGLQLIGGEGKLYIDDFSVSSESKTVAKEVIDVFPNGDFEVGTNKWADVGATPTITAGAGYNGTAGLVLTRTADASGTPYTSCGLSGLDTTGEVTYTVSFRAKAAGATWRLYVIETGSNNWQAVGDYNVTEWDTYSYQFTTTTGKAQFGLQLISGTGTLCVDDFSVTYDTQVYVQTYTEGIGQCVESGVATETDNVLYVKNYVDVSTATEIKAGTTYKYSFLMRNDATGNDFDFDVQVGGKKVADVAAGALAASEWTEVSGTFVATADADSFGFLRSGNGGVYIDDVVLMKIGSDEEGEQVPDSGETGDGSDAGEQQPEVTTGLVTSGNFEDGSYDYTTDWRVQGSTGSMTIVADPADADNTVLQFTATDANSGIDFNAGSARGFLEQGKTYTISFKYKGNAQFHIFTLGLTSAGHTLLDDWVTKSESDWTTYTCEITPSIDTTATSMQIYLKMATAAGGTFYIDDFTITEKAQ